MIDLQMVYPVFKNADTIEGRGPMVLHSVWQDSEFAIEWIRQEKSTMGARRENVKVGIYGMIAHGNGFEIKEMPLIGQISDLEEVITAQKLAAALQKLTPEERKLLGL